MPQDIKIGMAFGSYDTKLKEMAKQYKIENREPEKGVESEYVFRDKATGSIRGNAYRQKIKYDEHGNPYFSDAILFTSGYQYATSAKDENGLNKFDYIQGHKVYAIDINGNGKVDKGELFDGLLDRYAYKKAKEDGDLSKYQIYKNQYSYNWLK